MKKAIIVPTVNEIDQLTNDSDLSEETFRVPHSGDNILEIESFFFTIINPKHNAVIIKKIVWYENMFEKCLDEYTFMYDSFVKIYRNERVNIFNIHEM